MKYTCGLLVASAAIAFAQPRAHAHGHQHFHAHKARDVQNVRDVQHVTEKITVTVYELNGKLIPEGEVLAGIANGTLIWGDDEGEIEVAPVSLPVSIQTPEAKKLDTPTPTPEPSSTPAPEAPSAAAAPSSQAYSPPAVEPPKSYGGDGDFPDYDDSVSCDDFPSAFGAMSVDYLGMGGFIGIQDPKHKGSDGYDDISTTEFGSGGKCSGGSCCTEGAYCSYACPAGFQKTQWPSKQGRTKQSVGGLLCNNGKLTLTRGDVTKKLCERGTSAITVKVKNKMGQGASVCRTDYPGTESETVPVWIGGGSESDLACPDASTYYTWDGAATSAQYYVNPAGVGNSDACKWGDSSNPNVGNWAPMNIGVGYKDGKGWMSIFPNYPTTTTKLDFSVKISGDDISDQSCKYDAGKQMYFSDALGWQDKGCTVAVNSGTVYFEFE